MANPRKQIVSTLLNAAAIILAIFYAFPLTAGVGDKFYYEHDIMNESSYVEWVTTSIIREIVSGQKKRIARLNVNYETKNSMQAIRTAYAESPSTVDLSDLYQMTYAYSTSNAPFYTYMLGWGNNLRAMAGYLNQKAEDYIPYWRDNKLYPSMAVVAAIGVYKGCRYCKAPVDGPVVAKGAGVFASMKGVVISSIGLKVVLGAAALQASKVVGDYSFAGPQALTYYTNQLINNDVSSYTNSFTDSIYGFSAFDPPEYYNYYLDRTLFYRLQKSLLLFDKATTKITFDRIPLEYQGRLDKVSNAQALYSSGSKTLVDCYDQGDASKAPSLAQCNESNTKKIQPLIKKQGCHKYTFFNESTGEKPLLLVSTCSDNDKWAYLKFPYLKFARIDASKIADVIHSLSKFTRATKITTHSLAK